MKPKLVRNKIPQIITNAGKKCKWHYSDTYLFSPGSNLGKFLYDKMQEELDEFMEDPCVEEAADMFEVFSAIIETYGAVHQAEEGGYAPFSYQDVLDCAKHKREERGSFDVGIILEEVYE